MSFFYRSQPVLPPSRIALVCGSELSLWYRNQWKAVAQPRRNCEQCRQWEKVFEAVFSVQNVASSSVKRNALTDPRFLVADGLVRCVESYSLFTTSHRRVTLVSQTRSSANIAGVSCAVFSSDVHLNWGWSWWYVYYPCSRLSRFFLFWWLCILSRATLLAALNCGA